MSLEDYEVIFNCLCCGFETKKEAEVKKHEEVTKHTGQRWRVEAPGCGSRAKDSPHSNDVLESKGRDFAECLLELVTGIGPTVYEALLDGAPFKVEILWAIQLELVFLCLFLTDVVIFLSLGAEKRKVFMDALGIKMLDLLIRDLRQKDGAEDFGNSFFESLNLRQMKYSEYRDLVPGEGESYENTLFWEFAKTMATVHGNGNPMRGMLVYRAASGMYEPILQSLRILDVVPVPE